MKYFGLIVGLVFISPLITCNKLNIKVTDMKGSIIETSLKTIMNDYQLGGIQVLNTIVGQTRIIMCKPEVLSKKQKCTFVNPNGETFWMKAGAIYEGKQGL